MASSTDEESPIDVGNVMAAAINCRQSLERCLAITSLRNEDWAENRLADFNLWDSGLGASSVGRSSLKDRLTSKPYLRDAILNLLVVYQGSVELCAELGKITGSAVVDTRFANQLPGLDHNRSREHPFHQSSTVRLNTGTGGDVLDHCRSVGGGHTHVTLSKAKENADAVLNDLVGLAALIRKAGTRSRLLKADQTFNPNDPRLQALRDHLSLLVLSRPEQLNDPHEANSAHPISSIAKDLSIENNDGGTSSNPSIPSLIKSTNALTPVQTRLIIANLRRAHRFTYSREHGKRLEDKSRNLRDPSLSQQRPDNLNNDHYTPVPEPSTHASMGGSKGQSFDLLRRKSNDRQPVAGLVASTAASAVDTVVMTGGKRATPSRASHTVVSSTGSRISYPLPPHINDEARIFICPCCCVPLEGELAKPSQGLRWRFGLAISKHIAEG